MYIEAREIVFNEACRRYRGELSEANINKCTLDIDDRNQLINTFTAKDLVNLLGYVAGISARFTKSVLSDVKTLVSVKNHSTQHASSDQTHVDCDKSAQVTTDRTPTADLNKSHYSPGADSEN